MVDRVSSFLPTSRKRVLLFTAVLLCTACEVSQSTPDEGKRTFSNGKAEGGEQTLLEGEQELDSGCFPVTSYAGTALFDADDMREVAEAKQPLYNKLDMRGLLPRVTASNAGLLWRTNGMWTFVLPNQPPLPGRGAPPAHLAMSFLERTARWGPAALKVALLTQHNDAWCWFAPEAVLNFTTQSVDLAAHDWSGQTWDEDARLFSMNNGSFLGMSYSSVSVECKSDPTCKENVGGVRVATATLAVASDGVRLEVMRRDLFPPLGDSKFEKNWGFFPCSEAPDGACVVLRVQPLVVVANPSIDGPKGATLRHEVWQHPRQDVFGELRGGAPPVRLNDTLWLFVHSHLYTTYVITLDALSYAVTGYTLYAFNLYSGPVTFVCGAVFDVGDHSWLLSAGLDDVKVELARIPHALVAAAIVPYGTLAGIPMPEAGGAVPSFSAVQ